MGQISQGAGAVVWPVHKIQSGAYVKSSCSGIGGSGGFSSTNYSGKICFASVTLAKSLTLSALAIYCLTASTGKTGRLGIYSDVDGKPGALLLDAGTFSLTGGGVLKEVVASHTLSPGSYWLAFLSDATATADFDAVFGTAQPIALAPVPNTYASANSGYSGAQAWGVLPATPPALTATVNGPDILIKAA